MHSGWVGVEAVGRRRKKREMRCGGSDLLEFQDQNNACQLMPSLSHPPTHPFFSPTMAVILNVSLLDGSGSTCIAAFAVVVGVLLSVLSQ